MSAPLGVDERTDTDAPAALDARSLYRFFRRGDQETLALQGVSLSLAAGEMVALVGPSGSGKSTLLACLAGLDDPDGGRVRVAGETMTGLDQPARARLRGRRIGMVFQSANLLEHLSVAQNLRLVQHLGEGGERPDVDELLDQVGLTGRAGAAPSRLSGGEVARAGLAVALANRPAVVLADEPTGELDSDTEARILDLLRRTARRGTAILVASHSPAVAASCDRTITLVDGALEPAGPPAVSPDGIDGADEADRSVTR